MNTNVFIRKWYADFIPWIREAHLHDLAEVMSDCSSELYANSLTAMHLRRYAAKNGPPMFWSRCEWEKYDVCFGTVKLPVSNWEADYKTPSMKMTGCIEGKVTYWHYGDAKTKQIFQTLKDQLAAREGPRFGLIWLISYAYGQERHNVEELDASRSREWEESFSNASLMPITPEDHEGGPFVLVGRRDMKDVWPLADPPITSVSVALASFDEETSATGPRP